MLNLRSLAACLTLTSAHLITLAGPITDVFSEGVFGLPWGATLAQIKEKFPAGESIRSGGIASYKVKDSRSIFGLERPDRYIAFNLDADGSLNGVDIDFPLSNSVDLSSRMAKLNTLFGQSQKPTNSGYGLNYSWPAENGLKLDVHAVFGPFGFGGGTYVRVVYALPKPTLDKAALGLE